MADTGRYWTFLGGGGLWLAWPFTGNNKIMILCQIFVMAHHDLMIPANDNTFVLDAWPPRGSYGGYRLVLDLSGWWGSLVGVTKYQHRYCQAQASMHSFKSQQKCT